MINGYPYVRADTRARVELARHIVTAADAHDWTVLIDQTGGERVHRGPADHVAIDNVAAAAEATTHLMSLGRRRIAAIGAQRAASGVTAKLRLRGYQRILESAGLPTLVASAARWHRLDGARAMAELLDQDAKLDAVSCFNDPLALGAIRTLTERGYRVPDDVAVAGVDDIEDGRFSNPHPHHHRTRQATARPAPARERRHRQWPTTPRGHRRPSARHQGEHRRPNPISATVRRRHAAPKGQDRRLGRISPLWWSFPAETVITGAHFATANTRSRANCSRSATARRSARPTAGSGHGSSVPHSRRPCIPGWGRICIEPTYRNDCNTQRIHGGGGANHSTAWVYPERISQLGGNHHAKEIR